MDTKGLKLFVLFFCSLFITVFMQQNEMAKKPIYLNTAYTFKE